MDSRGSLEDWITAQKLLDTRCAEDSVGEQDRKLLHQELRASIVFTVLCSCWHSCRLEKI